MIWILFIPVLLYFLSVRNIFLFLRRAEAVKSENISFVRVSVIIPCKNEEKKLADLLYDLSLQDYSEDLFEVIIIDDNSSDNTSRTASAQKGIKNYKVLNNPGQGKKSAIGFGIENASGELIITTDADCRLGKRWISTHAVIYSSEHPDMIIGPVQLEEKAGFFGRFQELEFLSLQGVTAGTALAYKPVMCNGANLSFTKEAYLKHSKNLHPEILSGDDIFLLHSLKKDPESEIIWLNSSDGIVTTCQTESFMSFIKQRARWISKAGAYQDALTAYIAIITFATVLMTLFFMAWGIINHKFWLFLLISFIIKSVPDYLLLREITRKYRKNNLLKRFIPSQVVYPFYVLIVVVYSLLAGNKWK
jgi:biofilm PGA synthesis N-glycosyltransferase PgaC